MRICCTVLSFAALALAQQPAVGPDELLKKARRAALTYTISLPDFICTQTVRRFEDPRGNYPGMRKDILTVTLSYSDHKEDYKLTAINGKPTEVDSLEVGGPTTK